MRMVDSVHTEDSVIEDTRIEPGESIVQAIVSSVDPVADATVGSDPGDRQTANHTELPPLYTAIDTDALEALFSHARSHQGTVDWDLGFRYGDRYVTVSSDGQVATTPDSPLEVDCPSCEDAAVGVDAGDSVVDVTVECPACGHQWTASP